MQNRYVGDIGDFGKYGLLRCMTDGLKLGVVWYLVPDESHNADGKFVGYLAGDPKNLATLRSCDPDLYDELTTIVRSGFRSVNRIGLSGVLPSDTSFFADPLTFEGMPSIGRAARTNRLAHRERWVLQALSTTQDAEFIFLDPDNGIEVGTKRHEKYGPKFVYLDEIQPYLDRGQSVVVYQHIHRIGSAEDQVQRQLSRLRTELHGGQDAIALLYRRGTARVFFVIPASHHVETLRDRVHRFLTSEWIRHFELFGSAT